MIYNRGDKLVQEKRTPIDPAHRGENKERLIVDNDGDVNMTRTSREFTLHPLIHTFPTKNSAPDVGKKKSGAKNSASS
jgi:hypothetical protein